MLELDHLVLSAATLEAGRAHVEERLGVTLSDVGFHEYMGTHHRLLSLGPGLYFEVIAIDPGARRPAHPRWFDLDRFAGAPRLTNWVVRTGDIDAALRNAPEGMGAPVPLARGPFQWRFAVPADGRLPFDGMAPALIEWESALHPAEKLPDQGCRLGELIVEHPRIAALAAAFPALGDLPRVVLRAGPVPRLAARLDGPGGEMWLS